MPRSDNPDYYVDPDRGAGAPGLKHAELVDSDEAHDRRDEREGLRNLNARIQNDPGLHWATKARNRLYPEDRSAQLGHPRMKRTLPAEGEVRGSLSGRQRKERSKARHRAQARMPQTQLRALHQLTTDDHVWDDVNTKLSDHVGDLDALDEHDADRVRRIDRAIQAYERENDRGHLLYTAVDMPGWLNDANRAKFIANNFHPGDQVEFDRYTVGSHQMHEAIPAGGTDAIFELETRRGAYLGQSDHGTDTGHLLPRALVFEVAGVTQAEYTRPDGTTAKQLTVQLRDITPTDEEALL